VTLRNAALKQAGRTNATCNRVHSVAQAFSISVLIAIVAALVMVAR
jgi:hypothetical protein